MVRLCMCVSVWRVVWVRMGVRLGGGGVGMWDPTASAITTYTQGVLLRLLLAGRWWSLEMVGMLMGVS
jgi:hypothetical protein